MKVSLKSAALSTLAVALVGVFAAGCNNDSGGGTTTASNDGKTPTSNGPKLQLGSQDPDKSMIQIGLVASENGDLKPWGDDSLKGALLAVDEANAAGGVDGKKIQLLVEDSASKPEQGKTAAETLISKGVVGLVGEVSSGITAQIASPAKEKGLADVAVGATRIDLTQKYQPNLVRVCYTDSFQGPVMAKFAYEVKGLRNVALVTDKKQPYSTGLSDSFRDYFKKLGGTIVDEQFYESGQTQFAGILTGLKAKNPDGLFLSGYFTEVGPLVRQAHDAGINAVFMGGDGWDSSDILQSGGEAILGSYFCNHYNNEEARPAVKEFLTKWDQKIGGVPATTMGALCYDATKLLIDGIKRAGGPDKAKIIAALNDTEAFHGASGDISLKGHKGDPPKRALVVKLDAKKGQVFEHAYEPGPDGEPKDATQ